MPKDSKHSDSAADANVEGHVTRVKMTDWSELQRTLEAMAGIFIFRGQQRADWPLASSLERCGSIQPRGDEGHLLKRFKRSAGVYLPGHQIPQDTLSWLALMQHYGAPTRLLDFTSSPHVALFFALERANDQHEDRAVFAVNNSGLVMHTAKALGAHDGTDEWKFVMQVQDSPEATFELVRDGRSVLAAFPFTPSVLDERQTIQQTRMLVPGRIDVPFEKNFSNRLTNENYVVQFTFPDSLRPEAMSDLATMNITAASLFPGLDGFGRSMHSYVTLDDHNTLNKRRRERAAAVRKIVDIPSPEVEFLKRLNDKDRSRLADTDGQRKGDG